MDLDAEEILPGEVAFAPTPLWLAHKSFVDVLPYLDQRFQKEAPAAACRVEDPIPFGGLQEGANESADFSTGEVLAILSSGKCIPSLKMDVSFNRASA